MIGMMCQIDLYDTCAWVTVTAIVAGMLSVIPSDIARFIDPIVEAKAKYHLLV